MATTWLPSRRTVFIAAIVLVTLWASAQFYTDWLFGPGAEDTRAISGAVCDSDVLPPNTDVRCGFGLWQSEIVVYGVRDVATQDRVIEVVRATRDRLGAKPVKVEFRTGFATRPEAAELLRADLVR